MKISKTGYKKNSKDKNQKSLMVPSGLITMKEDNGEPLEKGPLVGIDNLGNMARLEPGLDYSFPGSYVYEVPIGKAKNGGYILPGRFRNPEGNWLSKYDQGGPKKPGDVTRVATPASHFSIGYTSNPNIIYFHDTGTDTWTKFNEQQTANFRKTNPSYFTAAAPAPKPIAKPAPVKKQVPQPIARPVAKPIAKAVPPLAPAPAPVPKVQAPISRPRDPLMYYTPEETAQDNTRYAADPFMGKQMQMQQLTKEAEQVNVPVVKVAQQKVKQQEEEKRIETEKAPQKVEVESMVSSDEESEFDLPVYLEENFVIPMQEAGNAGLNAILGVAEETARSIGDTYDSFTENESKDSFFSTLAPQIQYYREKNYGTDQAAESELQLFEDPTATAAPAPEQKQNIYSFDPKKVDLLSIDTDIDYGKGNSQFWGFRRTANNDDGFTYVPTPRKEKFGNGKGTANVAGMAHFLIESDLTDGYKSQGTTDGIERSIKHNQYIPVYKKDYNTGQVHMYYVKGKEALKEGYNYAANLRQLKLSDIDWHKSRKPAGYGKGVSNVLTKDGKDTFIVFKDADVDKDGIHRKMGRNNGNSLVFIIEKDGQRYIRDFAGTVTQIKNESKKITEEFGVPQDQVTLGFYDQGSYNAKPKAKDGFLPYSSYNSFHNSGVTGAGLAVPMYAYGGQISSGLPTKAYGGDISIPDLSRPNWLDKYQDGSEVKTTFKDWGTGVPKPAPPIRNPLSEDALRKGYTWSPELGVIAPQVEITAERPYDLVSVPGGHGSMVTAKRYKDSTMGYSPETIGAMNASNEIARSNNVDPITVGLAAAASLPIAGRLLGKEILGTGVSANNVLNPYFFYHGLKNFANPNSDFRQAVTKYNKGEGDWRSVVGEGGLNALNFLGARSVPSDLGALSKSALSKFAKTKTPEQLLSSSGSANLVEQLRNDLATEGIVSSQKTSNFPWKDIIQKGVEPWGYNIKSKLGDIKTLLLDSKNPRYIAPEKLHEEYANYVNGTRRYFPDKDIPAYEEWAQSLPIETTFPTKRMVIEDRFKKRLDENWMDPTIGNRAATWDMYLGKPQTTRPVYDISNLTTSASKPIYTIKQDYIDVRGVEKKMKSILPNLEWLEKKPDGSVTLPDRDLDMFGTMGGFNWNIKKLPNGNYQAYANDVWDLHPFRDSGSKLIRKTLGNLEVGKALGIGKPLDVRVGFEIDGATGKVIRTFEKGGSAKWLNKYQGDTRGSQFNKYDIMSGVYDDMRQAATPVSTYVDMPIPTEKQIEASIAEDKRVRKVMKETGAKSPAQARAMEQGISNLKSKQASSTIGADQVKEKSVGDYIKQGLNMATHPLTAFGYKARGQEIPWGFTEGNVNPMDYPLQFLGAAYGVKGALPYLNAPAQIGSKVLPGVTAGNAIGAGFAADAAVNRLPQIPGQLSRGEYVDAGSNALTGALDIGTAGRFSPLYKGAKSLLKRGLKEVTPDFSRFQTQYWPAEATPKESLDLEKLRTIYHNRNRYLDLQEMYDLNHYGHGDLNNYLTSARRSQLYGNTLPPPPSSIDFSTGTARLNYNQLPVGSEYLSGSYIPDYADASRMQSNSSAYDQLPEDVFRRFTQGRLQPNIDPAGNIDLLLPPRDRVISSIDDFDSAAEEWMRSNGMTEAQRHPEFPADITARYGPILDRYNLNNLSPDNFENAMTGLSNEQRQNLFRDMYQDLPNLFSQQEIRRMQIPSRSGFSNATVSQPRNASGFTREALLQKVDPSQHEKIANMTDEQFAETVLKPTGEVTESVKGVDVNDMTHDMASGRMVLRDAIPIGKDEYAKIFNDNIHILNDLIRSKYNKTGVDYEVSHLDPSGRLVFKTKEIPVKTKAPKEFEEAMSKLNSSDAKEHDEVLTKLTDSNGETFYQFNDLLTPRFYSKQEAKQWLDETISTLTKETTAPGGTTSWTVNINPALWKGEVKDISNTEYFKSIPGIDMSISSNSVFSDLKQRQGSGAYAAINEYLKMMDLGRVKPGFNSQSKSSLGAWEKFVKSGRGYGFYNYPSVVHGSMKTIAPYAIPTAAGAALLQKEKDGGESQGEGYYDYIKGKGSNAYSIFAEGGVSSKQSSWLNKYK